VRGALAPPVRVLPGSRMSFLASFPKVAPRGKERLVMLRLAAPAAAHDGDRPE
jgi:hypothetical protein